MICNIVNQTVPEHFSSQNIAIKLKITSKLNTRNHISLLLMVKMIFSRIHCIRSRMFNIKLNVLKLHFFFQTPMFSFINYSEHVSKR